MLEKFVSEPLLHTGAHVGYFSGLTMLLPILGDAWQNNIKPWLVSPYGFIVAIGLVILSVIILSFVVGSISKLTRSLGWMMLIPGILAILFAGFGQAEVYGWATNHITGFATAVPVIDWLVVHSVPKVAYLGGMYLLIGVVLIWIGNRIEAVSQFI